MRLFALIVILCGLQNSGQLRAAEARESVDALINQAAEAFDKGRREEGFAFCAGAIQTDPKSVKAYYVRGRFYALDRQPEKAIADYDVALKLDPKAAMVYQQRGLEYFKLTRIEQSVADFDKYIELVPQEAANHWQRGIACYYAKSYAAGRRQFELHQTVNPDDVENAVWHFLCVARSASIEKARESLMRISEDRRVPMMQIYALFGRKGSEEEVFAAAKTGNPPPAELKQRLFYAHLYVGLYQEATGHDKEAREHIFKAAEEYATENPMGDVARVHAALLRKQKP
jgi:lipoprotein NlpI